MSKTLLSALIVELRKYPHSKNLFPRSGHEAAVKYIMEQAEAGVLVEMSVWPPQALSKALERHLDSLREPLFSGIDIIAQSRHRVDLESALLNLPSEKLGAMSLLFSYLNDIHRSSNSHKSQSLSKIFAGVLIGSIPDEDVEYSESLIEIFISNPAIVCNAYERRGKTPVFSVEESFASNVLSGDSVAITPPNFNTHGEMNGGRRGSGRGGVSPDIVFQENIHLNVKLRALSEELEGVRRKFEAHRAVAADTIKDLQTKMALIEAHVSYDQSFAEVEAKQEIHSLHIKVSELTAHIATLETTKSLLVSQLGEATAAISLLQNKNHFLENELKERRREEERETVLAIETFNDIQSKIQQQRLLNSQLLSESHTY